MHVSAGARSTADQRHAARARQRAATFVIFAAVLFSGARGARATSSPSVGSSEARATDARSYQVRATVRHSASALVTLRTPGGSVDATLDHPVFVVGRGFVAARALKRGDQLLGIDGSPIPLLSAETRAIAPTKVFNLTVDHAHTFHVGRDAWLTHNAGRGCVELVPDLTAQRLPFGSEAWRAHAKARLDADPALTSLDPAARLYTPLPDQISIATRKRIYDAWEHRYPTEHDRGKALSDGFKERRGRLDDHQWLAISGPANNPNRYFSEVAESAQAPLWSMGDANAESYAMQKFYTTGGIPKGEPATRWARELGVQQALLRKLDPSLADEYAASRTAVFQAPPARFQAASQANAAHWNSRVTTAFLLETTRDLHGPTGRDLGAYLAKLPKESIGSDGVLLDAYAASLRAAELRKSELQAIWALKPVAGRAKAMDALQWESGDVVHNEFMQSLFAHPPAP